MVKCGLKDCVGLTTASHWCGLNPRNKQQLKVFGESLYGAIIGNYIDEA